MFWLCNEPYDNKDGCSKRVKSSYPSRVKSGKCRWKPENAVPEDVYVEVQEKVEEVQKDGMLDKVKDFLHV